MPEFRHTKEELKELQVRSLQGKIQLTQARIMEFYEYYGGKVCISFSGGKDSTVLLDLARRIYPDIPAVFADTGLEYPEIRDFAKNKKNITIVHPAMSFKSVIEQYGYPVVSKHIAQRISDYRKNPDREWIRKCFANEFTFNSHNIGKWGFLVNAPFLISHKCCYVIKKAPLKKFQKETGLKPIVGTMACEGVNRESGWLKTGCNSFKNGKSQPMSFWTEQDVLQYLKLTKIPYCEIYGEIKDDLGGQITLENFLGEKEVEERKLHLTGVSRTGCMFCMFGVQLEKSPNRFQRMKATHPKQYKYCIKELGCGQVLDYIGVGY